ncbi:hypothetical protein D3C87_602350 [compost metagenome]
MQLNWTYNWVKSPKKTTATLLTLFVIMAVTALALKSQTLVFSTIAVGCTLPTLLIIVWLSSSNSFKAMKDAPWLAVVAAAIVFIYTLFASTWASSQINEIFKVNPDFFPITSAALTFIHLQATIISEVVVNPTLAFSMIFIPTILVFTLFFWSKNGLKIILLLIISLIFSGAFYGFYRGLNQNLPTIIQYIALNSDFNEKFLCENDDARAAKSVVFLDGSYVLGYFPQLTEKYKVVPCQYPDMTPSHK